MVFHRSLSDCKSPQVTRTLHSILAVLSNAVIWIVSTRPPTSKSSSPFNNPLVIVPKAPITIGNYYYYYFALSEFFKPVLVGDRSLESEWQQVPSCVQDSPEYYSSWSQKFCRLEGFDSSDFQSFQYLL